MEGPISWITSGKVDAVLDIKFPRDPRDDLPLNTILGELADAISASIKDNMNDNPNPDIKHIPGQRELARPPLSVPDDESLDYQRRKAVNRQEGKEELKVVIDMDLRFRDLKAAVPIFTNDLSYVNNAFIRPIVAFMKCVSTISLAIQTIHMILSLIVVIVLWYQFTVEWWKTWMTLMAPGR